MVVAHEGETLAFVRALSDKQMRLILTSPPYNLGKAYEEPKALAEYMDEQAIVISELVRCLTDDGSFCWEVGNFVQDGQVVPLDVLFCRIFKSHGLKLRNRIIWHFGHGLHASRPFLGRYVFDRVLT
jgi:DNA modification methylase